jgi:hypothetical protein
VDIQDQRKGAFFDGCMKHVTEKYGPSIRFEHASDPTGLSTVLGVAPGDGDIRCFVPGDKTWKVMEDDDIHVNIAHDGSVAVGYTRVDQADNYGMRFKVGHPREVAELFQLLITPAAYLNSDKDELYHTVTLGEIFDFHVLVPDGKTWRMLNPAALPAHAPDDFRKAFYCNLNRDFDNLLSERTFEAFKFTQRWPDFVNALPEATDCLRAGYILDPEGDLFSAVDLTVMSPSTDDLFFKMLVVPSQADISSMYVRELINGDKQVCSDIRKSFTPAADLDAFMAAVKATQIRLPTTYQAQVRIAAEHNATREWLLSVTGRLANQRDCFYLLDEKHRHFAHTFAQLLDQSED